MKIIKGLLKKAKEVNATLILPEANADIRVYEASKILLKHKFAKIIVFGKAEQFDKDFQTPDCKIIDIETYDKTDFAKQLFQLRQSKGLKRQQADKLISNPLYFSMMMLVNNLADGVVAGACNTTADVLLPALQIIKTKPNKKFVTGSTLMIKQGKTPLLFGDVSLIENPDSATLAEIAVSNAEFMSNVIGIQPKVAMLSYSTKGSAKSEMVDKVKNAVAQAKEQSTFLIDGEMQADSALDFKTALKKGAGGEVGGNANVLIFPDLNAGNIGYKICSKLAGYKAIGPIMLNFKKPVNDLSRGSTVEEIVQTAMITKLLTQY